MIGKIEEGSITNIYYKTHEINGAEYTLVIVRCLTRWAVSYYNIVHIGKRLTDKLPFNRDALDEEITLNYFHSLQSITSRNNLLENSTYLSYIRKYDDNLITMWPKEVHSAITNYVTRNHLEKV